MTNRSGITLSSTVRDLGVMLDNEISMINMIGRVSSINRLGDPHLRTLMAIKPSLDKEASYTAEHAFVTVTDRRPAESFAGFAGCPYRSRLSSRRCA